MIVKDYYKKLYIKKLDNRIEVDKLLYFSDYKMDLGFRRGKIGEKTLLHHHPPPHAPVSQGSCIQTVRHTPIFLSNLRGVRHIV